ncbi:hypothetical protein NPIL_186761 [Nephila pilipes]|uniref:Uncharacterized protein n=1 Tax=Nephila pilipes TaxID=299642 RepID=A0A8X6MJG6_NEPPI|nr:hypothetical protein NPIL_186761 [Nephila pilipes]
MKVKKTANSREYPSKPYTPKRSSSDSRFDKTNQTGSTSSFSRGDKLKTDYRSERLSVSCYGYDKPGVTKLRCPNANQQRIRTQQILATSVCIHALQLQMKVRC